MSSFVQDCPGFCLLEKAHGGDPHDRSESLYELYSLNRYNQH